MALLVGALALAGIASPWAASVAGRAAAPGVAVGSSAAQNDSSGGSPSAAGAALCPSAGPTILGVEWNCVAVLDLTELVLILASIGIVAYVFRDADQAELPGESAAVPITAEEWEAFRQARALGVSYDPPGPPEEEAR